MTRACLPLAAAAAMWLASAGTAADTDTTVVEQDGVRLEFGRAVPSADVSYALAEAIYARVIVSRFLGRPAPALIRVKLVDKERIPYTDEHGIIWLPYGRLAGREPGVDPLTLVHETTHVIASGPPDTDRALTEGLAVYVQTVMGPKGYPNFGKSLDQATIAAQRDYGREIPFAQSETVRMNSESGAGRLLAYTQEGSFAQWLIETGGMKRFLRMLDRPNYVAVYGADLPALEKRWRDHLHA